jgi:hypothetical protein
VILVRLSRLLLAVCVVGVAVTLPNPAYAGESVDIKLQDVNGTGAAGSATLTVTDTGGLTVAIHSTGLTPNLPHAQHLHGAVNGMDTHCPGKATDRNGDGFISTEEGLPMYGGIFISLTTTGDTTWTSGLAINRMPKADAQGNLSYVRTIAAADLPDGTVEHLKDLHIVQHGIDANRNGQYDLAGLGESTFAKSVGVPNIPEEETDPATCGLAAAAAAADRPAGGVATGDGSTATGAGIGSTAIYAIGGTVILVALGTAAVRRRKPWRAEP